MKNGQPHKINTISAYHRFMGLPQPEHPLISVINFEAIRHPVDGSSTTLINNFYSIALKRNFNGKLKYGQQTYDFSEGVMSFVAPDQVFSVDDTLDVFELSGWMLVFHPDLLLKYPLAQKIGSYGFFSYQVHEALHLLDSEEVLLDYCRGR